MYAMPLIMGFITGSASLPGRVVLYWVTTNMLQIVQRYGNSKVGEEGGSQRTRRRQPA